MKVYKATKQASDYFVAIFGVNTEKSTWRKELKLSVEVKTLFARFSFQLVGQEIIEAK